MTLNDRRDIGRDPLAGQISEDAQGAAPRVLASPGEYAPRSTYDHECVLCHVLYDGSNAMSPCSASTRHMWRLIERAQDSAVWEPQADVLETGRVASHPGPVTEDASRIAEQTYPDGPLSSRRA